MKGCFGWGGLVDEWVSEVSGGSAGRRICLARHDPSSDESQMRPMRPRCSMEASS